MCLLFRDERGGKRRDGEHMVKEVRENVLC